MYVQICERRIFVRDPLQLRLTTELLYDSINITTMNHAFILKKTLTVKNCAEKWPHLLVLELEITADSSTAHLQDCSI